jgi:hypothetical protein
MADADWLRELRRVLNAELPEYMRDLVEAVPTDLVKQIAEDFRSYNPAPRSLTPPATATPIDAGRVVTGGDAPVASTGTGWADSPQIKDWKAPGLSIMDRMMDQQDAIDRAERIRQLAEASAVQRAEAALKEQPKEKEPEGKERKEREDKGGK